MTLASNSGSMKGPKKYKNREQQDMDVISELRDDILRRIISFLPLKDAARASVLSKRWTDLWKGKVQVY